MKIHIANMNYVFGGSGWLVKSSQISDKPWAVTTNAKIKRFRTHAQAIRWADKQVRKGKK